MNFQVTISSFLTVSPFIEGANIWNAPSPKRQNAHREMFRVSFFRIRVVRDRQLWFPSRLKLNVRFDAGAQEPGIFWRCCVVLRLVLGRCNADLSTVRPWPHGKLFSNFTFGAIRRVLERVADFAEVLRRDVTVALVVPLGSAAP